MRCLARVAFGLYRFDMIPRGTAPSAPSRGRAGDVARPTLPVEVRSPPAYAGQNPAKAPAVSIPYMKPSKTDLNVELHDRLYQIDPGMRARAYP